jgi:hypothetical protein
MRGKRLQVKGLEPLTMLGVCFLSMDVAFNSTPTKTERYEVGSHRRATVYPIDTYALVINQGSTVIEVALDLNKPPSCQVQQHLEIQNEDCLTLLTSPSGSLSTVITSGVSEVAC